MPTQITTKQPVPLNPIPHLGYPNGCLDCKPFPCVSQPSSRSPILLQVPKFKIEKENYLRIFFRERESRLRLSTEQWNGYKKNNTIPRMSSWSDVRSGRNLWWIRIRLATVHGNLPRFTFIHRSCHKFPANTPHSTVASLAL